MKRHIVLLAALSVLGISHPATSRVTLLIHRTGCLALKPLAPARLAVDEVDGSRAKSSDIAVDRVVTPPQNLTLQLKPGYYFVSISSQRCWRSRQMFVVGSRWNRSIAITPGIALPPPTNHSRPFIIVDYKPSSGLILHTGLSISKVLVQYRGHTDTMAHNRNVWYLDYAPVGPAKITLFARRRLVLTDNVDLKAYGFLEKSYASVK